jgi:hypothetical protein
VHDDHAAPEYGNVDEEPVAKPQHADLHGEGGNSHPSGHEAPAYGNVDDDEAFPHVAREKRSSSGAHEQLNEAYDDSDDDHQMAELYDNWETPNTKS